MKPSPALLTALFLALNSVSPAQSKEITPLPPGLERLMPPSTPYTLDAGASKTLLLPAEGPAQTTVNLSVRAAEAGKTEPMTFAWSVSAPSDASSVSFADSKKAQTRVQFKKSGSYFLRVDVKAREWTAWESVVIHVVSPRETGLAVSRFSAPPKPGVHPRIFFNPEELPALRERLKNTVIGREQAKKLAANSALLRQGMKGYDPKSPASKSLDGSPLVDNFGYFARSSVPYQKLVAGDPKALGDTIANMSGDISRLAEQMAGEALWCLITEDEKGAKDVAAAITTWAKIVSPTLKPEDDWQWDGQSFGQIKYGKQEMGRIFDKVGHDNLGLCYDFIYNYMTAEQRDTVRSFIATATAGRIGYGFDQPHYVRVGNWITFHTAALMILSLAIEGEKGYDPEIYRQGAEVFNDYYHYSVLEDGESFESIGKGGAAPLIVAPMAKRGNWVAANPHLRNYFRRYLPYCTEPYGEHFIALSSLGDSDLTGGKLIDVCLAKTLYPDDPMIELAYRNFAVKGYAGGFSMEGLLPLTLWGQDFKIPYGQNWEWDKTQPLTYVGRDQGLVVTRSDWSKDALYLFFDCGSNIRDMGHYDPARNLFILSALGRNWIADTGKEELAEAHNVVLIDGKGSSKGPGKLVDVQDTRDFTALCGDAKFAYDWLWERGSRTKGEVEPITVNDIRFEPQPERWMQTPLTYLYSFFSPFRLARLPYNPVQRAYRTALLRRGEHPYTLIADDIQKDDQTHRYEFILRLPDDLEKQVKVDGNDIILSDPGTDRRLLVRFLTPSAIEVTPRRVLLRADLKKEKPLLSVAANAVQPDFRVLFYPHHEGNPLPKSEWKPASRELILDVGSQHDVCLFSPGASGPPSITLR
jgi:hypothetical protein